MITTVLEKYWGWQENQRNADMRQTWGRNSLFWAPGQVPDSHRYETGLM